MDYISDPGIRTDSGAPLLTPWSARGMSDDAYAAQQAKDAHATAVSAAVAKAEQTPTLSAAGNSQDFITSEIQGLQKRLQVLQKLFASNPKGMAQALTQIFKELRAALKAYKAATGQEFAGADAAAAEAVAPAAPSDVSSSGTSSTASATPATPAATDQPPATDATSAAPDPATQAATPDASTTTSAPDPSSTAPATTDDAAAATDTPTAKAATASYAEVDQALREAIGTDGLRFLATLQGLLKAIDQKMETPAKIQHAVQKPDKDTDQAFKDMDDARKALDQDMSDMRDDISAGAPTLGLKVSVAA